MSQPVVVAVMELVTDFERHETAEWLRIDGKPIRDPHPEETNGQRLVTAGR